MKSEQDYATMINETVSSITPKVFVIVNTILSRAREAGMIDQSEIIGMTFQGFMETAKDFVKSWHNSLPKDEKLPGKDVPVRCHLGTVATLLVVAGALTSLAGAIAKAGKVVNHDKLKITTVDVKASFDGGKSPFDPSCN